MKSFFLGKSSFTLLAFFAIFLFTAIFVVFYSQRSPGGEEGYTVQLREDGFYPRELTIGKGDSVTFTATRGKPFWPASNLHPTHTIYPAFDAREPIDPDKSWSFTFTRPGEWRYHDHLTSSFIAKITVKEKAQDKNYGLDCENLENLDIQTKRACFRILLEDSFQKGGASAAFELVRTLYKTEPEYIVAGCHKQAHEIGDLAYGEYLKHKNFAQLDIPQQAKILCGAGFYHGFFEHYFRDNPDIRLAKKLCDELESRNPGTKTTCYHTMGHGFMPEPPHVAAWGDPQAILDPVLKKCDTISDETIEVLECHEGAFNVLLDWMDISQYGLSFDKKDPFALYENQVTREREYACYYESAMRVHGLAGNDIARVAELFIDDIQDDQMAGVAIGSAVATVIEAHLDQDSFVEYMLSCRNLEKRLRDSCTASVPYGVIYHGEPGKEYVKALALCRSPKLSDNEKAVCYQKLSSYMPVYWPEKKEEICQAFEEKYQGFCP